MEDYLNYLNSFKKNVDHYHQPNRRPNYPREYKECRDNRDRDRDTRDRDVRDRDTQHKHRRQREFKDYDDPDQSQSATISSSRNLISYDDL